MPNVQVAPEPVNTQNYKRRGFLSQWNARAPEVGESSDYADLYSKLFSPDPADTPDCKRPSLSPEQSLWWAVLEDAIQIFLLRPRDRYRITLGENERVRRWILSETDRPGGFQYACIALKLEHETVRRELVKTRRALVQVEW